MFKLVRTDSYMINPNETSEYHDSNFPIGEIIMSPRKKNSILKSLNKELNDKFKKKNLIFS